MKRRDECQYCGYVFRSEEDEPDYISEIGEAPDPAFKGRMVCPVCGEKRGSRSARLKKEPESD